MVRKTVGYSRYETEGELLLLNQLFILLGLYTNFFQLLTRLIGKERLQSKIKKHYDIPKTPFLRVIASPRVDQITKQSLQNQYDTLNPAELKRQMVKIQNQLIDMVISKTRSLSAPEEVNLV